jgi:hypothetical protein
MYPAYEQARDRQLDMLNMAVEQRHGLMVQRQGRAARRVERAEARLARTRWDSEAIALNAELAGLEMAQRQR